MAGVLPEALLGCPHPTEPSSRSARFSSSATVTGSAGSPWHTTNRLLRKYGRATVGRNLPPYNTRQPQLWRHAKAASPQQGLLCLEVMGRHPSARAPASLGPFRMSAIRLGHGYLASQLRPRAFTRGKACASLGAKVLISRGLGQPPWGNGWQNERHGLHDTEPMFGRAAILPSPPEVLAFDYPTTASVGVDSSAQQATLRGRPFPPAPGKPAGNSGSESNLHKFVNRYWWAIMILPGRDWTMTDTAEQLWSTCSAHLRRQVPEPTSTHGSPRWRW